MKKAIAAFTLAVLVVVSVAATRGSDGPRWKYLCVRLPANTVEVEFSQGGGVKLKNTVVTPLDSLGRDGWELVSAVKDGTTYTCFFRQSADEKNSTIESCEPCGASSARP
jgi:hypothetical protein